MKPHAVGSACHRVQAALDEALSTGTFSLPAELAAHAERCPRCGPDVTGTQTLLNRLTAGAAGISLGQVPQAVDRVMMAITSEAAFPKASPQARRQVGTRWVLGQVAAVAAVLLITIGGVGFVLLKVNEVVSGVAPGEVMARLVAPLRTTDTAKVQQAK